MSGLLRGIRLVVVAVALATLSGSVAFGDDWPQWMGSQRDGVWRETGILKKLPKDGLKPEWRCELAQGYSGPAVADGKIFVTDWQRAANVKPPSSAFSRAQMAGKERVHCMDQKTGKVIWTHEYPCNYSVSYPGGPRCTPLYHDGKVYTLGTMGNLFCLDVKDKRVIWSKDFVKDYGSAVPLWGFAAHPLLSGDRLICIVGGKDKSLVVAFHKDTGKELWRAADTGGEGPGYCPPVIVKVGSVRQLIIWDPEAIRGLDPESGKIHWTEPFQLRAGLSIPMPRLEGDRLFVTAFYNGPVMLQLAQDKPGARVLWRGRSNSERKTDGLHSIMTTPVVKDGFIYGVCSYGQLRCLRVDSGARVWESLEATGGKEERWGHAFIIPHEDRYFLFNEHGELIIADLSPDGYREQSRAKIIEPTNNMAGRWVVWMHPAFANKTIYVRNDREILAISLAEKK
jgi:outer membrane protein assembly factor BamB